MSTMKAMQSELGRMNSRFKELVKTQSDKPLVDPGEELLFVDLLHIPRTFDRRRWSEEERQRHKDMHTKFWDQLRKERDAELERQRVRLEEIKREKEAKQARRGERAGRKEKRAERKRKLQEAMVSVTLLIERGVTTLAGMVKESSLDKRTLRRALKRKVREGKLLLDGKTYTLPHQTEVRAEKQVKLAQRKERKKQKASEKRTRTPITRTRLKTKT